MSKGFLIVVFALSAFFFFPFFTMPALIAGDPYSAYYSKDNDKIFWFIQISDIHIGASGTQDSNNLRWIVTEAKNVIKPEFIVATGDLTDSTNGGIIPNGPYLSEWTEYFQILSNAGMDENFYYDIPGNHDHYNDKNFVYYLNNSIQGRAAGKTQVSWRKDFPFGSYHFIGVCTAGNDGARFSIFPAQNYGDHAGLDLTELDFIETELENNQDVELTLIFGHHPLKPTGNSADTYLTYGTSAFTSLMETYGVSAYSFGHTHQFNEELLKEDLLLTPNSAGVYYLNVSSLGKATNNQYNIIAIDCNGISTTAQNVNTWPVVLITAPLDKNYGKNINPYAYNLTNLHLKPIRALVFDKLPVTQVRFRIDSGAWQPMFNVPAN